MRYVFQEVSVKGTRRWVESSGKKKQETKKFFQTVRPFNRDANGNIKTHEQIYAEIRAERDAWLASKEYPHE